MLKLKDTITIAAGETKEVKVYFKGKKDIGIIESSFRLKDEGIIFLHSWYEGQQNVYIHKLLTTISVNPYPRACTRAVNEEEYTTINKDESIAYIIDVLENI